MHKPDCYPLSLMKVVFYIGLSNPEIISVDQFSSERLQWFYSDAGKSRVARCAVFNELAVGREMLLIPSNKISFSVES